MKTRYTLLYMLTALLSLLGIQTVQAQETQDALYIYRNDGQFIAFFYGDIDHIEYSKIDTLGVEQPDYVVQEIYALDSVFRIPVSAIDSVAFVTPETKIKSDVFCPDKSIASYIVASDSVYWIRLALNTPASLIPEVGAKLLIEEESKYIPDGFGGLVADVTKGSDGYTVMTKGLKLTDIYDQLVVKVAGASPGMQPAQARRDVGLDGVDIAVPETEIPIPTVSGTLSLKKSQALLPDNSYAELNGEIQGSVSSTVATKVRLRAFLTITPFTGMRYYQETFVTTETESAVALTGGLSGRIEAPLLPTPVHTFKKGMLKVELGVGLFLEAQATALTLTLKNSKVETTRTNTTMEESDIATVGGVPVFNPYHRWSTVVERDTTEMDISTTGQYSLAFGAFAKAEAKFSIPIEKTPKFVQAWTKSDTLGFKATLGIDVGTKLEYSGPLSTGSSENLLETIPVYTSLNQGNVALSAYLKFVAGLSCCGWTAEATPEFKFWEPINRGLVPEMKSIKAMENPEMPYRPYRILMMATTGNRKVLAGSNVGFAIFENQQELVADSLSAFYWVGKDEEDWEWRGSTNRYECVFELDPIKDDYRSLTVYPMVELWGKKLLADQSFDFKLDPARIDIEQRELFVGKAPGSQEIEVVPNMANVEVTAEADWLKQIGPSWVAHENQLTIYWPELPDDVQDRRGVIRLIGKSQKGEVLVEDSIVVVQFEPFMELTPDKLEFSEKGGTQKVTIGKTNLTNLTVSTNTDEIKATLEDKTITVTMGKNTSDKVRGGTVYIEGTASNKQRVKVPLTVTQKEGKPIPQGGGDLELSTYFVEIATRGYNVGNNNEKAYIDVLTENIYELDLKSDQDFLSLKYSYSNKKIEIDYKTNTTTKDRIATVTVTATLRDHTTRTATFVVLQPGYYRIQNFKVFSKVVWKYHNTNTDKDVIDDDFFYTMGGGCYENNEITPVFIVTENGDGSIHCEGTTRSHSPWSNDPVINTISFDLPEGLNSKVVNNLKSHEEQISESGVYTEDFEATNIPLIKGAYPDDPWPQLRWEGTEADGVVITDGRMHHTKDTGGYNNRQFIHDPRNLVWVELEYTTVPDE